MDRDVVRLIAKLDVKPPYVVKPVHFEGLRKVGTPRQLSAKYYEEGVDEIFYIDIVASLYQRKILSEFVRGVAEEVFIPLAVGGGVRTIDNCSELFHNGADKIVINTHALQEDASLVNKSASIFGSQATVVNIEAKHINGTWFCYSDCGRIMSGRKVVDWVKEVEDRGAGEILLQSVDKDGRRLGFDLDLACEVVDLLKIPVVIGSGAGNISHIVDLVQNARPSGIAISSILHFDLATVSEIKSKLSAISAEVQA